MSHEKLYWLMMPPFLIMALIAYFFLPFDYRNSAFVVLVLFWTTYYGLKYQLVKKANRE
ncbi:hypothetical protein H0266_04595 [Halobacillus locisalis]|uniref:Uncharacterized protein n=1 Tax=Halobacillus locisalis TaxID=220753 RepID=A0A838CQL5_9BACI|nr:hypothetical protein [Halobacillus locisalis]MBA2174178.1 hypothetical protein [Halobacillus locisalis]